MPETSTITEELKETTTGYSALDEVDFSGPTSDIVNSIKITSIQKNI